MEQQVEEERIAWKRGQQSKENEHLEQQKKLNELTQDLLKLRDESDAEKAELKERCLQNEKAFVLKTKELAELKERVEARLARRAAPAIARSEEIQAAPAAPSLQTAVLSGSGKASMNP